MFEKEYGKFTLYCDCCDKEIKGLEDFQAVVDYKKFEDWKSRKIRDKNNNIEWIDICPDCKGKV